MSMIYVLIPISLIMLFIAVAIYYWAVNNGQYDDMEGPKYQILQDDKLKVREKHVD